MAALGAVRVFVKGCKVFDPPKPLRYVPKLVSRKQVWAQYPYEAANSDELSFPLGAHLLLFGPAVEVSSVTTVSPFFRVSGFGFRVQGFG